MSPPQRTLLEAVYGLALTTEELARGGQLEAIREILGHRDIKMTLTYAPSPPGTCAPR